MIWYTILHWYYSVVLWTMRPILAQPDASISPDLAASIQNASSYLHILDVVIPVGTIVAIVAAFLVYEGVIFGYKIIRWVYTKIPGVS